MKNDLGIGVEKPKDTCTDSKCPWHGELSVRGKVVECTVVSTHAHLTAIVERGYHQFIPKYQRYERRKSRIVAHSPTCISANKGDKVIIAECRPLSKTKQFVIVSKVGGKKK